MPVNLSHRVRRNATLKATGELSRIFSVLFFVLTARYLGNAEFGVFSLALASAIFMAVLADGGMNQLLVRDIARDASAGMIRSQLTLGIKHALSPLIVL